MSMHRYFVGARRWLPLSPGQAAIRPGVRLGPGGGLAVDRGPGRVLDRVGPTREDPRSGPSELPRLSLAHSDARAGDGIAGFLPRRGSRVPGYFQGILEQQVSGPVAIVIAALLIAPAHGLTQGFVWPILLWYFFADVMFGAMAYFTKSSLPGIVVHSIGLLIFFTLVWSYDAQRRLAWETGANTGFWIAAAQAIIFTVLALLAFSQLASVTNRVRDPGSKPLLPASADEPVG